MNQRILDARTNSHSRIEGGFYIFSTQLKGVLKMTIFLTKRPLNNLS